MTIIRCKGFINLGIDEPVPSSVFFPKLKAVVHLSMIKASAPSGSTMHVSTDQACNRHPLLLRPFGTAKVH